MMQRTFLAVMLFGGFTLLAACGGPDEQAAVNVPEPVAPYAPTKQMAIVQTGNGGPEVLSYESIPVLEPGVGQVLIEVYAAAVNPIDWKIREGMGGGSRPPGVDKGGPEGSPPGEGGPGGAPAAGSGQRVPGMDVAGVVAKVGVGVTKVKVGNPVFSMIGRVQVDGLNGGYSHYVIAPADNVAPKPGTLTYAQAAGLGTASMTAARSVYSAGVKKGQRFFINGIAGGVGSSAAQIGKARGAYVLGTATSRHHEFLDSLGVDQAIDYRQVRFEEAIEEPVDAALDTVGPETATRALEILKEGGILVSIAGGPDTVACEAAGVVCPRGGPGALGGPSEGDFLREVGELAEAGKFTVNVDATFPLARAADAQEENRDGGTEGKIILIVDEAMANMK